MSDETPTKGLKVPGRKRTYSDEEAARAHRLYVDENFSGADVAAVMRRPRTTVLEMVRYWATKIGGHPTQPETP